MKYCLSDKIVLNNGETDKKIRIDEKMFLRAVMLISEDIKRKYDLTKNDVGLLGIARGAMPLLIAVAHYLDIRRISVMQVQMTNSDNVKDYGDPRYLDEMLDPDINQYIILEDIVSHGRCSNLAINRLVVYKEKAVKDVYSIVMNEAFEYKEYDYKNVNVNYVYMINDKQWVYFLWEKGYLN